MERIFIGGTRSITKLDDSVKQKIDSIINKGFHVLIGDEYGIDVLLQMYLAKKGYRNVTVYHTGSKCRNNIGNWNTKSVQPGKGIGYYTAKDVAMANDADYGFMIWDGESEETRRNIDQLRQMGKVVVIRYIEDIKCP